VVKREMQGERGEGVYILYKLYTLHTCFSDILQSLAS
jgi:hypothetical protein